ncbi:MAG: toll/interleukin-1 receptor domain-containing protein [Chloroflexota bacterium]
MKHVFISYKREDVEFVFELEQQLKQADVDVWTDAQIQAGQNWRSKIDDALQDAFAVIVVMTPEARTSEYVTYEWAFAMGLGKPIVPLTITPTELHPKLFDVQYVDFTDPDNRDWGKLIVTMQALNPEAHQLGDVPRSVKQAVEQLDSLEAERHKQALEVLDMIVPHPSAIKALAQATTHLMLDVRQEASSILSRQITSHDVALFDDSVPLFVPALYDFNSRVIRNVLNLMEHIGNDECLSALVDWYGSQTNQSTKIEFAKSIEKVLDQRTLSSGGLRDYPTSDELYKRLESASRLTEESLEDIYKAIDIFVDVFKVVDTLNNFHLVDCMHKLMQVLYVYADNQTIDVIVKYQDIILRKDGRGYPNFLAWFVLFDHKLEQSLLLIKEQDGQEKDALINTISYIPIEYAYPLFQGLYHHFSSNYRLETAITNGLVNRENALPYLAEAVYRSENEDVKNAIEMAFKDMNRHEEFLSVLDDL